MVKNIFDYADEPIENQQTSEVIKEQVQNQGLDYEKLQQTFNKYQSMPQDQIVQEFLSMAKQQKNSGQLNKQNLDQISSTLSPFLNNQQKEFLDTLIHKIDE